MGEATKPKYPGVAQTVPHPASTVGDEVERGRGAGGGSGTTRSPSICVARTCRGFPVILRLATVLAERLTPTRKRSSRR
jgi:hypothetical protein